MRNSTSAPNPNAGLTVQDRRQAEGTEVARLLSTAMNMEICIKDNELEEYVATKLPQKKV